MRSLSNFIGTWTISREIDDLRAKSQAQLHGTCVFERSANGDVIQFEQGQIIMPGMAHPIAAERRYIWRAHETHIGVYFADGRFFHSIDPSIDHPEAGHDCDPDRYDVRYDFSACSGATSSFTSRWQVSGPRKDYVSVTKFTLKSRV
jgi:hypothetical protein